MCHTYSRQAFCIAHQACHLAQQTSHMTIEYHTWSHSSPLDHSSFSQCITHHLTIPSLRHLAFFASGTNHPVHHTQHRMYQMCFEKSSKNPIPVTLSSFSQCITDHPSFAAIIQPLSNQCIQHYSANEHLD